MANPGRGGGRRVGRAMDGEELVFETSEGVEPIGSFDEMGMDENVVRGIYSYGYERPSAIQQRAIMPILQGRDVIAQAQSGTGKTSTIALSVCQVVDTRCREYVVCPLCSDLHCLLMSWMIRFLGFARIDYWTSRL